MNPIQKIRAQFDEAFAPYVSRARGAIRGVTAQARARFLKLEPRERVLVQIAGGVLSLFLIYNLVYLPIEDWRSSIETRIETRTRDLSDVQHLVDIYLQRKSELVTAEKATVPKSRDFSLFSIIEKSLTQSIGHDKIASITPGTDRKLSDGFTQYPVELKLQNVNLAQLVDALYGVKTLSSPVAVSDMRVTRRAQDPHSYDVDVTCIALSKNG